MCCFALQVQVGKQAITCKRHGTPYGVRTHADSCRCPLQCITKCNLKAVSSQAVSHAAPRCYACQLHGLTRSALCRTLDSTQRAASVGSAARSTVFPAAALLASSESTAAEDVAEGDRIAEGGWPFTRMADQLCVDLLDSNWEVRHGAVVGLRELLACHAASAYVSAPAAPTASGALLDQVFRLAYFRKLRARLCSLLTYDR